MCEACEQTVDVSAIMDRVVHDEPLTLSERRAILASLMLWQLVPPHTRDAILDDHLREIQYDVAAATTAVN